jgi:hypothetical protein
MQPTALFSSPSASSPASPQLCNNTGRWNGGVIGDLDGVSRGNANWGGGLGAVANFPPAGEIIIRTNAFVESCHTAARGSGRVFVFLIGGHPQHEACEGFRF